MMGRGPRKVLDRWVEADLAREAERGRLARAYRREGLLRAVSERARLCSLEVLLEIGGRPAYSLAQGQ